LPDRSFSHVGSEVDETVKPAVTRKQAAAAADAASDLNAFDIIVLLGRRLGVIVGVGVAVVLAVLAVSWNRPVQNLFTVEVELASLQDREELARSPFELADNVAKRLGYSMTQEHALELGIAATVVGPYLLRLQATAGTDISDVLRRVGASLLLSQAQGIETYRKASEEKIRYAEQELKEVEASRSELVGVIDQLGAPLASSLVVVLATGVTETTKKLEELRSEIAADRFKRASIAAGQVGNVQRFVASPPTPLWLIAFAALIGGLIVGVTVVLMWEGLVHARARSRQA
jgi:hypothetical protein